MVPVDQLWLIRDPLFEPEVWLIWVILLVSFYFLAKYIKVGMAVIVAYLTAHRWRFVLRCIRVFPLFMVIGVSTIAGTYWVIHAFREYHLMHIPLPAGAWPATYLAFLIWLMWIFLTPASAARSRDPEQ